MALSSSSRTSSPSDCFLVLDGEKPIAVTAVEGGAIVGDVASDPAGAVTRKQIAAVRTSDISFSVGLPLPEVLQSWLASVIGGKVVRLGGAFVLVDSSKRIRERRLFVDALPVEVELPTLDASSKSALRLRVTLSVGSLAFEKGDNSKLSLPVSGKTKAALASNFRLDLGDLPTKRLVAVESGPLTVKVTEKGRLQVDTPDLQLRLATLDIQAWRDFADTFLVHGANGPENELQGRLVVLDSKLKDELLALELQGVGLRTFAPDWPAQGDKLSRFEVRLYVERISFAGAGKLGAFQSAAQGAAKPAASPARRVPRSASEQSGGSGNARARSASEG